MDGPAPHAALDGHAPHAALDGPAPHAALDGPAPHAALDGPAPHSALDGPAPHAALDGPALDGPAPHAAVWRALAVVRALGLDLAAIVGYAVALARRGEAALTPRAPCCSRPAVHKSRTNARRGRGTTLGTGREA